MLRGLRKANEDREADIVLANPVLPEDVLKGAVPGNIRTADHFISFLKRLIEYIKTRLRSQHVIQETPASFLKDIQQKVCIERKPLRFCAERLSSLMRTLEVTDTIEFGGLVVVCISPTLCADSSGLFHVHSSCRSHISRHSFQRTRKDSRLSSNRSTIRRQRSRIRCCISAVSIRRLRSSPSSSDSRAL